jgi:phage terminase large subunit-like protein
MADDDFDAAKIMRLARQSLTSAEYRRKFSLLDYWGAPGVGLPPSGAPDDFGTIFYSAQLEFLHAGVRHNQRLIRGGNQVGKSFVCAYEVALHMTGRYPKFWTGRRFSKPIRCWVVGVTAQLVRDGPQRQLTARQQEFGSGTIPLSALVGYKPIMTPGGTQSIDTLSCNHETNGKRDGTSTLTFKSFEQGPEKLQSESIDLIWVDERCSEDIYNELLARTTATNGAIILSYTPLREKAGGTLTTRFLEEFNPDRFDISLIIDDATHISPAKRKSLEESYRPSELQARLYGIPQVGGHLIFEGVRVSDLMREVIPDGENATIKSWALWICDIDFGLGGRAHPFAGALCAFVPDLEEFYVIDGFLMRDREDVMHHAKRIANMCRGYKIPIAWPHDGAAQGELGTGKPRSKMQIYKDCGLPMLPNFAYNHPNIGDNSRDVPLEEMYAAMRGNSKFVIANHLHELAGEIAAYHRDADSQKIVSINDDLLSAVRYCWMSRRLGKNPLRCDEYGRIPGAPTGDMWRPQHQRPRNNGPQIAKGVDFDLF